MKLKEQFPNYLSALLFIIGDKNPALGSNDSKKFSYFLPIRNTKRTFDYYELNRTSDGGVYFCLVTMSGLKTIKETGSKVIYNDLSEEDWNILIYQASMKHFSSEKYMAIKNGSIKSTGGCAGIIAALIISTLSILFI